VEIVHAGSHRSSGVLLAGWLAAQLGWVLVEAPDESSLSFADCVGETIRVLLEEAAGNRSAVALFSAARLNITSCTAAALICLRLPCKWMAKRACSS